MSSRSRRLVLVGLLGACGSKPEAPKLGTRLGPALAAAIAAADGARVPWRCAAADGPTLAEETLTIEGASWKASGHTLQLDADDKKPISIAVIADAGGAAPATIAALGRLRRAFGDVDLVLALGGMGATQPELEATLGALGDHASWPVVAVPGDLELMPAQRGAIAALRARGQYVFDGRLARRIELPGATIAIVPGSSSAARLVAGAEGCSHRASEVTSALVELTPRIKLRILATAEAPRVDVRGEPAGDLALTAAAPHEIDIALHGPVTEAASAARTGKRDGQATPLTPGTSDATTRLPGARRRATAGVLTMTGTAWRWRSLADTE